MRKSQPRKWNSSKLPFLEEKLEFRKKALDGIDHDGTVLCIYAGGEARLTRLYAKYFRKVIAVDKRLPELPENVLRFEMSDRKFLKNFVDDLPEVIEILDLDPYGSPMPFLSAFLERYNGIIKRIVLTDGALTTIRLKRRINMFKYYGLLPNEVVKPESWHYHHFPEIVFARVKELVQGKGYVITYYDYMFNRYKMGMYARVDLWKGNGENSF